MDIESIGMGIIEFLLSLLTELFKFIWNALSDKGVLGVVVIIAIIFIMLGTLRKR